MTVNPWDDEDDYVEEENKNPYLAQPELSVALIHSLLEKRNSGAKYVDRVNTIIDESIMSFLHKLDNKQRDVAELLIRVKTQLGELHKVGILTNKAILGVGGKFSAGKSCFINSLTDAGLPEDTKPTTSIATYIIKSDHKENQAITANDCSVLLDDAAVEALTHEFSKMYGIGFVRVIDNLVIHSPTFLYSNIAILDTPGYSKADLGKNADATDAEIALRQLRSADALVWLMDIENGVINDSDLKFLESLNTKAKILFVFNKADLRPKDTVQEIVDETKKILQSRLDFSEKAIAVIAYSSVLRETIIGDEVLSNFLKNVSDLSKEKVSVTKEVKQAEKMVIQDLKDQIKSLKDRASSCEKILESSVSPNRISSIIQELRDCRESIWRLNDTTQKLNCAFKELNANIKRLLETKV